MYDAYRILNSRYQIKEKIGSGAFGTVYSAEDLQIHKKVAVKEVSKRQFEGMEYLEKAFKKELAIMKLCECENSISLLFHFEDQNNHYIVMELCDSDLEVIKNKKQIGFNEEEMKVIIRQMNVILIKMEKEHVIHRDLKLKNILVKYDKSIPLLGFVCKLADFGFSKTMSFENITRTKLGTPATMAPEIFFNQDYNQKADLWSWGVIIYQLLFNRLPFDGKNEKNIMMDLKKKKYFDIPPEYQGIISYELRNLIMSLLQVDQKKRLDYEQYFNHPYIKSLYPNGIEHIRKENKIENDLNRNRTGKDSYKERFDSIKIILEDPTFAYTLKEAKDKITGKDVFLKEIVKEKIDSSHKNKEILYKEIELMKSLKGECFIEYIDAYRTNSHYVIVTESFSGKGLEEFIQYKGKFPEALAKKIIFSLIPAFKEINNKGIILEYISTNSFRFKNWVSENNFCIKFFDYGLSAIDLSLVNKREYTLGEDERETNVLSIGLVLYKMITNQRMISFTEGEEVKDKIRNLKTVKLPENIVISNKCIKFIEKVCAIQRDRRYTWEQLINDPFLKDNDDKIKGGNMVDGIEIEDSKLEYIASLLQEKINNIVGYYNKLLYSERKLELQLYWKFYKEMAICAMLTSLEIKFFLEFLKGKKNFYEDEEIHLIQIFPQIFSDGKLSNTTPQYHYSIINCLKDKVIINRDNNYLNSLRKHFILMETQLKNITSIFLKTLDINIENTDNEDYMTKSVKDYLNGNLEKYFFDVFERAILSYSKKDYSTAFEESKIAIYCCEYIIFIRLITSDKKETIQINEMLTSLNKPNINSIKDDEFFILISFIGGAIKAFKNQNIIEDKENCDNSPKMFESLINLYPDIINLLKQSENKINNQN